MRIIPCIILFACLVCPPIAMADAAPDPLNKGIRPHRRSSRVEMTAEEVDITLKSDLCRVTARFVFTNPTDVTETMEVGFPSSYPAEIINPLVHVDGQRAVTRSDMDRETQTTVIDEKVYNKHLDTHWLLWDMTFAAQQTRHVTVTYGVKPFDTADYVVTPYTKHRFAIKDEFAAHEWTISPEVRRVLDAIQSRTTGYVLQTGAGWGGSIGKAIIKAGPVSLIRWAKPLKTATKLGNKFQWQLHDVEPDFDIFVGFNPGISLAEEQKLAKKAAFRHPNSHALREYVAFLAAVSGNTGGY